MGGAWNAANGGVGVGNWGGSKLDVGHCAPMWDIWGNVAGVAWVRDELLAGVPAGVTEDTEGERRVTKWGVRCAS